MQTVEQLQAHALTRFAEVFLNASPEQRGASFTPSTLFTAPVDETEDAGLAESAYGQMIPRNVPPGAGKSCSASPPVP